MALSVEYDSRVAICLRPDDEVSRGGDYPTSPTDHHLVLAARSGCRSAFDELWNLYSRRVYSTVLNITKNRQDAEDALQDSFFRAFLALESFEGRSSFYSWVTRIAINSALGMLRKRRGRPQSSHALTFEHEEERPPGRWSTWHQALSRCMTRSRDAHNLCRRSRDSLPTCRRLFRHA